MRPMTRLVLGIVVLAGILAAVALGLPSHVTVTRSVVINAPESVIFPYLNNLHQFGDWSPWSVRDPQLAVSYGGPETGQGAQVKWTSKKPSIGTGSMEISETEPNRRIDLAVNFNGLEGTSSYDVVPSGSGSKVTWTFGYDSGSSPLKRWKALMLDGFVGTEYRSRPRPAQGEDRSGTAPDDADHQPDPAGRRVILSPGSPPRPCRQERRRTGAPAAARRGLAAGSGGATSGSGSDRRHSHAARAATPPAAQPSTAPAAADSAPAPAQPRRKGSGGSSNSRTRSC